MVFVSEDEGVLLTDGTFRQPINKETRESFLKSKPKWFREIMKHKARCGRPKIINISEEWQ